MKKILLSLLTASIIIFTAVCSASCSCGNSFSPVEPGVTTPPEYTDENGISYNTKDDGSLYVVSSKAKAESIEIPSSYKNMKVTSVGRSAFKMSDAVSVVLPETITSIDDYAFSFSSKLEEVKISEGVKYIGANAFSGCINLKGVTLPESLEKIDIFAFDGSGLEGIIIPKKVTTVGEYAFAECEKLRNVEFMNKNTEIGEDTFKRSINVNIIADKNSPLITVAKSTGISYTCK